MTKRNRIHLDDNRLHALRTGTNPALARYRDALIAWVDQNQGWTPPQDLSRESRTMEVVLEESAAFLTNAALTALITGEQRHVNQALQWALALAQLPGPSVQANNYAFGIHAAGLGRALNWLGDELSADDSEVLIDCIAHCVSDMVRGSHRGDAKAQWWAEAYLHHDHWVATGGYGEAALTIIDRVAEATDWAERARQEFETALLWLGDDGAWLEGAADLVYAWSPMLAFYGAYHSVKGTDLHHLHPWLRASATFRLHHLLPDGSYIYCNDSFRSGRYNTGGAASCHLLRRLASIFDDPHAQWLADRDELFDLTAGPKGVAEAAYEGHSVASQWQEYADTKSVCAAWNALWYDPDVTSRTPDDLDPVAHFENQGQLIIRSDWSEQATVATLSCGPLAGHKAAIRYASSDGAIPDVNINHAHVDYGAFTLFANGRYVMIPAGYGRRDSGYQNTIAIEGAPLSTDPAKRPWLGTVARNGAATFAVTDFTETLAETLGVDRCQRKALFLSPDIIFLVDDIYRQRQPSRIFGRLTWNVHHDPRIHTTRTDGRICDWIHNDDIDLRLHILTPSMMAWERAEQSDVTTGQAFLGRTTVCIPEWREQEMTVAAILAPPDVGVAMYPVKGGQGALLRRDNRLTLAVIATPGDGGAGKIDYVLDAPHDLVIATCDGKTTKVHLDCRNQGSDPRQD